MFRLFGRESLVPIPDMPAMSVGAPQVIVNHDDERLELSYLLEPDCRIRAVIGFVWPRAHTLGPPNDEALHGHRLWSRGLQPYSAFEVLHSAWIRDMERRNRVHPLHSPARFAGTRHFVFTFKENVFEAVAHDLKVIARLANEPEGIGFVQRSPWASRAP